MIGPLDEQIRKAERRAGSLDLRGLAAAARQAPPCDIASDAALDDRRRLMTATMDDRAEAEIAFERLILGDELQPINYLQRGVTAARPVCRIELIEASGRRSGFATGFLIAPGVLITNQHVLPDAGAAAASLAAFDVELDMFGAPRVPATFPLRPDRLFLTSPALDFTVVAVEAESREGTPLAPYGFLPLIAATGKAVEGEWLTIVQHPGGEPKQICIRENQLLARTEDVLWYSTDTAGGSSGAPVFNNEWQVVALHHKGVPETKDGAIRTIDDRAFDPSRDDESAIRWIANEGIRVSRLVEALRDMAPDVPLLEPVLAMTVARARSLTDGFAITAAPGAREPEIVETVTPVAAPPRREERPAEYEIAADPDYGPGGDRQGYAADWLGPGFEVQLPILGALEAVATPLLVPEGENRHVLRYRGYSAVMHAERRFAIYTAANVDGGNRYSLRRGSDDWRYDPRIPKAAQIGNFYYKSNQFDRGHLTRYEDMEYGEDVDAALASAADTLHWTNCAPQHARFNQSAELWQGLEQRVLEQSVKARRFAAQVLTGPVLDPGDPVWDRFRDIRYPARFWKIAVARTSADALFAAGFVLDQREVIDRYGIEATVEVPFDAFKTFQVPIAEIERLTGLRFICGADADQRSLSTADPLAGDGAVDPNEATSGVGYRLLRDATDLVLAA